MYAIGLLSVKICSWWLIWQAWKTEMQTKMIDLVISFGLFVLASNSTGEAISYKHTDDGSERAHHKRS